MARHTSNGCPFADAADCRAKLKYTPIYEGRKNPNKALLSDVPRGTRR